MRKSKAFDYLEEEVRLILAKDNLTLAKEYFGGAKDFSQTKKFLRGIVDLSYNSAELAVKGLLSLKISHLPSTHGGLVQKFGQVYIKTKILPARFGRGLNQGLELRNKARYEPKAKITTSMASQGLKLAKDLIRILEGKISQGERRL